MTAQTDYRKLAVRALERARLGLAVKIMMPADPEGCARVRRELGAAFGAGTPVNAVDMGRAGRVCVAEDATLDRPKIVVDASPRRHTPVMEF